MTLLSNILTAANLVLLCCVIAGSSALAQTPEPRQQAVVIGDVVNTLGWITVKPEEVGELDFAAEGLVFTDKRVHAAIAPTAIRSAVLEKTNGPLLRGIANHIAGMAPQGAGMLYKAIRPATETMTLLYTDDNHALHAAVVVLPFKATEMARQGLASEGIQVAMVLDTAGPADASPTAPPPAGGADLPTATSVATPVSTASSPVVTNQVETSQAGADQVGATAPAASPQAAGADQTTIVAVAPRPGAPPAGVPDKRPSIRVLFPRSEAEGGRAMFLGGIYEDLIEQLVKSRGYANVWRDGDDRADPKALTLELAVARVKKGNAGARNAIPVIGALVGGTEIEADVHVTDAAGVSVMSRRVEGTKRLPGESMVVTRSLATHVTEALKSALKPPPCAGDACDKPA